MKDYKESRVVGEWQPSSVRKQRRNRNILFTFIVVACLISWHAANKTDVAAIHAEAVKSDNSLQMEAMQRTQVEAERKANLALQAVNNAR